MNNDSLMKFHQVEDISVFEPVGELDEFEGRNLLQRISSLIRFDWGKIVIDLKEVDHIHFRTIRELLLAASFCSSLSGAMKLANLNSYTRELLKITGVDRDFETYDSVAEAILSFETPLTGSCELQ